MRYTEGFSKGIKARPGYSMTMSLDDMEKIDAQCCELKSGEFKGLKVLNIEGLTVFATVGQLEQIHEIIGAELEKSKVAVSRGVASE